MQQPALSNNKESNKKVTNNKCPVLTASVLVILLFETCALFARSYARIQLESGGMAQLLAKNLSWLIVPLILGILMLPILRQNWRSLTELYHFRHLTIRLVLAAIALGICLRLAVWGGLIANAGFQLFASHSPNDFDGFMFSFYCPSAPVLALTTLVTVILTPLVEEVINRGFFLQAFIRRGRWVAIIGSSVLFGIYHNPQMIGPASIIGIFLAVQFLNARNLWAPTIAHATVNALVIVDWYCLNGSWNPASVTPGSAAVGSLALALLITSLLLAAMLTSRKWYVVRGSGCDAPRPSDSLQ